MRSYASTHPTNPGGMELNLRPVPSTFHPFTIRLKNDMRSVLETKISINGNPHGFLYGFKCTAEPDFIKIRYARTSPEKRVKTWKNCHSDAEIVFHEHFPFFSRMESLIHMQPIDMRYVMIITCEFAALYTVSGLNSRQSMSRQ